MKREGRQHGVVRKGKEITTNASGVVVDLARARAPLKPSNHSKHTGKCRKARCVHCHLHPVSKSRDKAKGSYKLKSSDVVLNHRLLTWRVAPEGSSNSSSTRDILNWNKYSGASASGILDALATSDSCYWSSGGDDCEDQGSDYEENYIAKEEEEHEDNNDDEEDDEKEDEDEDEGDEDKDEDEDEGDEDKDEDEGEEDDMGFCQVGMVWEYMDEEGWCVLGEN